MEDIEDGFVHVSASLVSRLQNGAPETEKAFGVDFKDLPTSSHLHSRRRSLVLCRKTSLPTCTDVSDGLRQSWRVVEDFAKMVSNSSLFAIQENEDEK